MTNEKPQSYNYKASTGETIVRDLTDEEYAEYLQNEINAGEPSGLIDETPSAD
jgi:hypothetical protein